MADEKTKEIIFSLCEKIRRDLDIEFNFLCALYGVNFDKSVFDLKILKNSLKYRGVRIDIPAIPTRENVLKDKFYSLRTFNHEYSEIRSVIVKKYFLRFIKLQKINPYNLLRGKRLYPYYLIMNGILMGVPTSLHLIHAFLNTYCDLICENDKLFKFELREYFEKYDYGRYLPYV